MTEHANRAGRLTEWIVVGAFSWLLVVLSAQTLSWFVSDGALIIALDYLRSGPAVSIAVMALMTGLVLAMFRWHGLTTWPRRVAVLTVAIFVLALAVFIYIRAGWSHMEYHCPNGHGDFEQVGFSWSWKPLGFTCIYEGGERDGEVETSLWF